MPEYKQVEKLTKVGYEFMIGPGGTKHWYLDGMLHRVDGPALVYPNGDEYWYLHTGLHREDGPAIEFSDGAKRWYLDGIGVTEEDFNEVWNCPFDRLPLYINTPLAPIMRRRLKENK